MTGIFPWLILFLPLAAVAGIVLFALDDRALSARLSIGAVLGSFALSLVLFLQGAHGETAVNWIALTTARPPGSWTSGCGWTR